MRKRNVLLLIGIFLLVLSGLRFFWMDTFRTLPHAHIKNGELDLRQWDAEEGDVFLLDGEWEFYPNTLLMEQAKEQESISINVPGKWNEKWVKDEATPYGYGSYRLRLFVPLEDRRKNYSLYISSIRSASEVYVNDRLIAGSGQVATTEEKYIAKNLPYIATFSADEDGEIDIIVQVTNYKDVRSGGISRSIKFGSTEAILKERNFSLLMQGIASAIFFMHSIYALVLYFLGNRERKLLFFSLLLFCITLMNLLSSDEKIFHLLFYIGYEWDFRLANITAPLAFYALIRCLDHREIPYWRVIHPFFAILSLGYAFVLLFLTPAQILQSSPIYAPIAGLAILLTLFVFVKKLYKDFTGNVLLFLSLLAIVHHFSWVVFWRNQGISVIHYPVDLIIAIGCLASVWFKGYFKMHTETENLALRLQKANKYKDQFLANTAHEFKNPLHSMISMSQAILTREKGRLEERSVREFETILTVGRRLSLLLNDLLDVESLRHGNPRIHQRKISLQSNIIAVIDIVRFMSDMKPVEIVNEVPESFPPVLADENRLTQILYNLLHNAMKYTEEGTITIKASVEEDFASISVSDTGIGMDQEFLEQLFLPYEQAQDVPLLESGLGLGLSITKQLVKLHGGKLKVSSVLDEGSTFTFTLPLADEAEELMSSKKAYNHPLLEKGIYSQEPLQAATLEPEEQSKSGQKFQVLVVDDDPINLQVIESMFSNTEYEITTTLSAQEALGLIDEQNWDLMISDIMMPHMSGYELTKLVRERYSLTELPILLLTARQSPQDLQTGFLAGANDYVTKPVEMLELRSRVKALTMVKRAVHERLQLEAVWLQAQIQPHFLFNTLNSIMALSMIDIDQMNELLNELVKYLRSKFQYHYMDELIPIEEELNIVRSYVNIEKFRFGNRLKVCFDFEDQLDFKIPFLSIQPLVENAIRHGVMQQMRGGTVTIKITQTDKEAIVSIEDDGIGMDPVEIEHVFQRGTLQGGSVGISNTNQRLLRHYGKGLDITSEKNKGTIVSFMVNL